MSNHPEFYFARLGAKTHWPCTLIPASDYDDDMKAVVARETNKKKKGGGGFVKLVRFFEEEGFHIITKETELIPYESDQKEELIRKTAATLTTKTSTQQLTKYKTDIIRVETLLGKRSESLSTLYFEKLVSMDTQKSKSNIVKELFSTAPPPPPPPPQPQHSPLKRPQKPLPQKTTPTPPTSELSTPPKRYPCGCGLSFDRINVLTIHRKSGCQGKPPVSMGANSPQKKSPRKKPPKKVTKKQQELEEKQKVNDLLKDWSKEEEEEVEEDDESEEDDSSPSKMPKLRLFETQADLPVGVVMGEVGGEESISMETASMKMKKSAVEMFDDLVKVKNKEEESGGRSQEGEEFSDDEGVVMTAVVEVATPPVPVLKKPTATIKPTTAATATTPTPDPEIGTPPEETPEITDKPTILDSSETPPPPPSSSEPPPLDPTHQEEVQEPHPLPLLESDQLLHLVPMENADGSITYMLLSLDSTSGEVKMATDDVSNQLIVAGETSTSVATTTTTGQIDTAFFIQAGEEGEEQGEGSGGVPLGALLGGRK